MAQYTPFTSFIVDGSLAQAESLVDRCEVVELLFNALVQTLTPKFSRVTTRVRRACRLVIDLRVPEGCHCVVTGDALSVACAAVPAWCALGGDIINKDTPAVAAGPHTPGAIIILENPRGTRALALSAHYVYIVLYIRAILVLDSHAPDWCARITALVAELAKLLTPFLLTVED